MIAALGALLVFLGFAGLFGGAAAQRRLSRLTLPGGWPRWWGGAALLVLLGVTLTVGRTLAVLGFTAPGDVLAYLTTTGPGRAALTTLLGTALLLAAQVGGGSRTLSLGVTVLTAAVTAWGIAGQGHGAEHGGPALRLAHALHTGAMALWVGGVAALTLGTLPLGTPQAWSVAARAFTPVAVVSVGVLALSGTYMGLEHAGPLGQWPATSYGRLVLVKVGLLAATLLAALRVRRRLARPGRPGAAIAVELGLLLVILGVTAVLANSAPPGHG